MPALRVTALDARVSALWLGVSRPIRRFQPPSTRQLLQGEHIVAHSHNDLDRVETSCLVDFGLPEFVASDAVEKTVRSGDLGLLGRRREGVPGAGGVAGPQAPL